MYGAEVFKKSQVYEWHKRLADVKENETKSLKHISDNEFHKCLEQLYDLWGKCVVA